MNKKTRFVVDISLNQLPIGQTEEQNTSEHPRGTWFDLIGLQTSDPDDDGVTSLGGHLGEVDGNFFGIGRFSM